MIICCLCITHCFTCGYVISNDLGTKSFLTFPLMQITREMCIIILKSGCAINIVTIVTTTTTMAKLQCRKLQLSFKQNVLYTSTFYLSNYILCNYILTLSLHSH